MRRLPHAALATTVLGIACVAISANAQTPSLSRQSAAAAEQESVLQRAHSQLDAGTPAAAEETLRTYLKSAPDSGEAQRLLGYTYYREAKAKESLQAYTLAARTVTPNPDDLRIVAFDYVLLSDFADADKWLTEVAKQRPADASAWYYLGRAKYNENRFAEAIEAFQTSLRLKPNDVRTEDNLGLSYQGLNRNAEAQAAYRTAIDWQRDAANRNEQPYLNLGILLVESGDLHGALPNLQQAAAIAPENPKVREQLGRVYQQLGQMNEARTELERAVELAPNISGLHFQLGMVYRNLGLKDKAKTEFARCAELNGTQSAKETPNPVAR